MTQALPDLMLMEQPWRRGKGWRWSSRLLAGFTAFSFASLQLPAPSVSAEQEPLPAQVAPDRGDWVSPARARQMQSADQQLLANLETLRQTVQQIRPSDPEGEGPAQAPARILRPSTPSSLDTNQDGFVAPLDALQIINHLNSKRAGPPATEEEEHLDVNRDDYIAPMDILLIINHLNLGKPAPTLELELAGPDTAGASQLPFSLRPTDPQTQLQQIRWRLEKPDGALTAWTWQTSFNLAPAGELTSEGSYTLQIQAQYPETYWSGTFEHPFTVDRTAPQVILTSGTLTNQPEYTLAYTVDGAARSEQVNLREGENMLARSFTDPAGNSASATWIITLDTVPPDTTPPVLTLVSPSITDSERYEAQIAADGEILSTEQWSLGRGDHRLIAEATDAAGNLAHAALPVTRTGELPIPTDPRQIPEGSRLTQTLADGSVALYVDGVLAEVTTPEGARLIAPVRDEAGRITDGWLEMPDGSVVAIEEGLLLWSKTALGAIYWYLPDGRVEAVRGADGTLTSYAYRLDGAGEVEAVLLTTPAEILLYNAEGEFLQRFDGEGRPVEGGSLEETLAGMILVEEDGRITGLSTDRDGITRTYDTQGNLQTLALSDQTLLRFDENGSVQAIELPDGSVVQQGAFDSESRLVSGVVTLPDGRRVTYADGAPTEAQLPDGSAIRYTDGRPTELTLPDGLSYTLTRQENSTGSDPALWVATLTGSDPGSSGSDPNRFSQLVYTSDWQLLEAVRGDGAMLTYQDGRLSILTQPDGVVISYAYDEQGRLASTVAAGPDTAEPALRTEYAYDKIRRVLKGSDPGTSGSDPLWVLLYDYSYEFGPDGAEIAVIHDLASMLVKRYREGLLLSQTDPDGAVTTYEYTADPAGYQDPMENALEARQMLPDGTFAHYHRLSPTSPWELEGTNPEAELPTDRLSLFRLERQGRLEAVGVQAAAAGPGSLKIAAATVLYQGRQRAAYTYRYEGTLTRVTDQEGVSRVYDETNRLVAVEQIEGPSYSVSAARDLSAEQEALLAGMDPASPEALEILGHPDGEEISVHRLTWLTPADGTVITENFAPDTITAQEFDSEGRLLTRSQANGQITLYEDGWPTQILDTEGNITTTFTYNEPGQLVRLTLHGARRELADETAAARTEVIRKRADALEELAIRKQLAIGQIADQTAQARAQLQAQGADLGQTLSDLENTDVHGRSAKKQKGRALDQIRGGMNQVRDALSSLDGQYAQALGGLESQVESVRNQLESQSASAFASITAQEEEFTRQIIRQEILVILTRVYRNVIGRDPDEKETSEAVDQLYAQFGADPDAELDLAALERKIQALPDYPVRVQQVDQIRQQVSAKLDTWETASDEQKAAQLAPYGVHWGQVVPLNPESIAEIRTWLNTNSLHFGHSAFLALQGLLAQAEGIQVDAVTLAVEAIWLDIVTGVISPRTTGDLELSLFSMEHVSEKYSLSVTPARVSLEDLKALLPKEITLFQAVSPDGRTSYELKEDGTLEIADLSSDQVTQTVSLFSGLTATEPSIAFTRQTDGSLLLQTQGLPVGGVVSFWTENDQNGEAGVYYIKPLDANRSYFTLPAEGVARIPPGLSYRPGHARVLVFKDAQAIATFQQRQRELHPWSPFYATNFFKDILVTRPWVSYKISDLDKMKADSSFMSSTGLMAFDLGSDGQLTEMGGFWNPPPDAVFTPQQMLLTPDGNTLWVRASGKTRTGAALLSLDLQTGAVSQFDTGLITPAQMALSLDGTVLYVQDAASPEGGLSSIAAMDAATGQVLRRASLPVASLAGMAVSAGNQILLAGKGTQQALWLDADTLQTIRSAGVSGAIESLALRPDGQAVYLFDNVSQRLAVFSAITGELLSRVQTGGASGEVAFSPDGTVVYFTRHDTGTVLRLDAASHQPIQEVREGESGATQAFRRRTAPILAHVNGNHYLHVLAVAADGKILVREPNKGPNGSIIALSAEEFSRIWQGVILSPRAPPHAYQMLTDSEALSITGSFFPVLFAIFAAVASAISAAIGAIIGAVAALLTTLGTVLSSVFSALGSVFSSIGSFFGGFGSLFSGAGLVGQGFSAIFAGQILGGLSLIGQGLLGAVGLSSFSWAGLGQFALTTAVNVGVSRGLEALGVSPTIASLGGAFVSGGVTGALSFSPATTTQTLFGATLSSAVTNTAGAGTQLTLTKAGLDPQLASLAGVGVGSITNHLATNGLAGLGDMLKTSLAPTLAGELAFYGIQRLGESIGLDPRISVLAGIPVRNGISSYLTRNTSEQIMESIGAGLVRGATSVGLEFAADELDLDPLVGSLATAALSGSIEAMLEGRNSLLGVADTYMKSATGLLTLGGPGTTAWERSLYLSKINDFSSIIREQGIASALETYATSIFHRQTIENIWKLGGIYDLLANQDQIEFRTNDDGVQIKRVYTDAQKPDYIELALNDDRLLGKREGNIIMHCEYVKGPDGKFVLRSGEVEVLSKDGTYVAQREVVRDFKLVLVTKYDKDGNAVESIYSIDSRGVEVDSKGQLTHGVRHNHFLETKTTLRDGKVVKLEYHNRYTPATEEERRLLLDMGYADNDIRKLEQTVTGVFQYGNHALTAVVHMPDGSPVATGTPTGQAWLRIIKGRLEQTTSYFVRPAYRAMPQTVVEIDREKHVAQVDMELTWPGMPLEALVTRSSLLGIALYAIFNNLDWSTATRDAYPHLAALHTNRDADFVFLPGVNSQGKSLGELYRMKLSLETEEVVNLFHSAGNEIGAFSLPFAPSGKYIFTSPRMDPDVLYDWMKKAGVTSDQVIVVTTRGDFPSHSILGNQSYVALAPGRWTNIHIEDGPGVNWWSLGFGSHSVPIEEWLSGERYTVEVNGERRENVTLAEVYRDVVNNH